MSTLSPELTQAFFENAAEGFIITDPSGIILSVNPAFSKITGYSSTEAINKKASLLKSDRHSESFYKTMWDDLKKNGHYEGDVWNRRKNGEAYLQKNKLIKITSSTGETTHYICLFSDATPDQNLNPKKNEEFSNDDMLTGLPNRFLFQDHLLFSILQAKNENKLCAVFFINLDRFQHINNSFGFLTGDLLLIDLAQRIKNMLKDNEMIYRIGADHFAVIAPNCSHVQDIYRQAKNMLNQINSKPFFLEDVEIISTVSIGISIYPLDAQDIRDLVQNAQTSMRRAKANGGNQFQLYAPEMNLKSFENLMLESKLRKALERNEFLVYYQPQIDLNTRKLVGAEALVRWNDPDLGLVSPDYFIPLSEEIGMIQAIGEWVLETACAQLKKWQAQKNDLDMIIAVNLSAHQLKDENLVEKISNILTKTQLGTRYLEVEITESATVNSINKFIQILNKIHSLGIKIAIDDFGTGYSSLKYLKNFPLHKLKIDKSFIIDLLLDPKAKAIVDTIITLAHNLDLLVIAEGAESIEQIQALKDLGCNQIQGYYYCAPVPASQFEKLYILP